MSVLIGIRAPAITVGELYGLNGLASALLFQTTEGSECPEGISGKARERALLPLAQKKRMYHKSKAGTLRPDGREIKQFFFNY